MGIDDRDYDYRPRGHAERRRGPGASSDASGRSYQRGRSNDYDDPRSSSGSRYDRSGYDRRPRSDQSGSGRRPRPDWDDDPTMRRDRRSADPYARGSSSGRSQRPPRDDWEASARSRGGPRSPSPADSGARNRRAGSAVASPRGGGLWGDQPMNGPGVRRGAIDQRDPRARRGMPQPEEEETSSAAAFGKGLMAIFMALLIGAGAAYGYYVFSTPKLPAGISQPPAASPTTAPTVSPTAAPTKTATGLRSTPAQPAYTFVVAPTSPRA